MAEGMRVLLYRKVLICTFKMGCHMTTEKYRVNPGKVHKVWTLLILQIFGGGIQSFSVFPDVSLTMRRNCHDESHYSEFQCIY